MTTQNPLPWKSFHPPKIRHHQMYLSNDNSQNIVLRQYQKTPMNGFTNKFILHNTKQYCKHDIGSQKIDCLISVPSLTAEYAYHKANCANK